MSRKRRRTPSSPATVPEPALEPAPTVTGTGPKPNVVAVRAVPHTIAPTSDDALAIRRLRERLVDKLFTPDRSLNSWTDLKATN